jgi:FkbM family methyltransferase
MKPFIPSSAVRLICHAVSPPGRLAAWLLGALDGRILEPERPKTVRTRFGFRMEIRNPHEFIQRNIYYRGYWEWYLSRCIRGLLTHGDLFIDVGANVGWYSLLAAGRIGDSGRVIAFEPATHNRELLEWNLKVNGLENVAVEPLALSEGPGEAVLHGVNPTNDGMFSIIGQASLQDPRSERVRTDSLDNFCESRGINSVGMVKIDVEGAEALVFRGMQRLISRRVISYIVFEFAKWQLSSGSETPADWVRTLEGNGYVCRRVSRLGLRPMPASLDVDFMQIVAARDGGRGRARQSSSKVGSELSRL